MFAQVSEETARTFIERVPEIIRAAATNPLGLVALIVLMLGILVYFLFKKASSKIKLYALLVIAVCVVVLALVAIRESGQPPPPKPVASCKVSGFVYNEDVTPAVGLQKVRLAYIAANAGSSESVPVATTAPDGSFSFNCSQIQEEAFPIHLRATFAARGGEQSIESEDQLVFGENASVNLYLSPRAVSNHYRVSHEILKIPSRQLLRQNFTSVTNAAPAALSANKVAVIPRTVRLPKEAVTRLRTAQ